jgi:hypothetical protein
MLDWGSRRVSRWKHCKRPSGDRPHIKPWGVIAIRREEASGILVRCRGNSPLGLSVRSPGMYVVTRHFESEAYPGGCFVLHWRETECRKSTVFTPHWAEPPHGNWRGNQVTNAREILYREKPYTGGCSGPYSIFINFGRGTGCPKLHMFRASGCYC